MKSLHCGIMNSVKECIRCYMLHDNIQSHSACLEPGSQARLICRLYKGKSGTNNSIQEMLVIDLNRGLCLMDMSFHAARSQFHKKNSSDPADHHFRNWYAVWYSMSTFWSLIYPKQMPIRILCMSLDWEETLEVGEAADSVHTGRRVSHWTEAEAKPLSAKPRLPQVFLLMYGC